MVESDEEDFFEFRLGNDDGGIMRQRSSLEDGAPELIHYIKQNGSMSRVSLNGSSTSIAGNSDDRKASVTSFAGSAPSASASAVSLAGSTAVSESSRSQHEAHERAALQDSQTSVQANQEEHQANSQTTQNAQSNARADATTQADPQDNQDNPHHYRQNALGEIEQDDEDDSDDGDWLPMQTVGSSEEYDEYGNLVVHRQGDLTQVNNVAAKGYTRVGVDDDAKSITSLDEKTDHLFDKDDGDAKDQIQTMKTMLSESQRIAYVGLCRLVMASMANMLRETTSGLSPVPIESLQMWGSRIMMRLYAHMELNNDEQLMIEELAHHGVLASDLTPQLRTAQTFKNGEIKEVKEGADDISIGDLHTASDTTGKSAKDNAIDVRWTVLCDLFLNLVSEGLYDARSRTLLQKVAAELAVSWRDVDQFERKVTDAMQLEEASDQKWEEQEVIEAHRVKALKKRYAYIGLATLGGGLVIGLSAGLLAPVIGAGLAAGLTTVGITGTSGFLAGAGGAALVTTTGAAIGARVGLNGMSRRMGHVKTFEFRPIYNFQRVNVIVTVSGWMNGKEDDVRLPFSTVDPSMGDLLSVLWEPEMMQSTGQTINILATEALTQSVQQILGATILTALMASLQLPMALSKLGYLLDNPWNVSLDRAWAAGLVLADTLMQRHLGARPAILVGFSLGARVIYACLTELARQNAFGLVQDVYLFGAPVVYSKKAFARARSVVNGRFVNGYSRKDWILGYLFRATSGGLGTVLGLAPVNNIHHVENMDVTELVDGHMSYRKQMPKLMKECGWLVLSEEFDEIEDPDPEKYRDRQRQLLNQLEQAEEKPKKKSFFSWGRKRDKTWLETAKASTATDDKAPQDDVPADGGFDLDAIRNEVGKIERMDVEMVFDAEAEEEMAEANKVKDELRGPLPELEAVEEPAPTAPHGPLDVLTRAFTSNPPKGTIEVKMVNEPLAATNAVSESAPGSAPEFVPEPVSAPESKSASTPVSAYASAASASPAPAIKEPEPLNEEALEPEPEPEPESEPEPEPEPESAPQPPKLFTPEDVPTMSFDDFEEDD